MLWLAQYLRDRPLLDDLARLHHRDPVGDVGDDTEVVRDEHDAQVLHFAQPLELPEDLCLHGHVERGRRLVGEQHLRAQREGHRDHHALAHAAGELVGIGAHALGGTRNADSLHQRNGPDHALSVGDEWFVRPDLLDDLIADPVHRVQGRLRVLEDHRQLRPSDAPQLGLGRADQVAPFEHRIAGDRRVRPARQPHQAHRAHRLARARLAHDRQHFTAAEPEGHAVHRLDTAIARGKGHTQIVHVEQRADATGGYGSNTSGRLMHQPMRLRAPKILAADGHNLTRGSSTA